MVDTAQVVYEYTAGNTLSFPTNDLMITPRRPFLSIDIRPDGTMLVTDPSVVQRVFECTATLTGSNVKILHDLQAGVIDYTGAYPRLTLITFATGQTITNVEVAITGCTFTDMGAGMWRVRMQFTEKTA